MQKILIIDDQLYLRKIVITMLGINNYTFYEAEDGEQGLSIAQTEIPDLIILDLVLPGLRGQQVLEKLKSQEITKTIPVIILSAKYHKNAILSTLTAGALFFISKPMEKNNFVKQISIALEAHDIIGEADSLSLNTEPDDEKILMLLERIKKENILGLDGFVVRIAGSNKVEIITRIEAIHLIGHLKIKDADELLIEIIENEVAQLQEKAIWAISQFENKEMIPLLYKIAEDDIYKVETRLSACLGIKELGKEDLIYSLYINLKKQLQEML